MISDQNTPTLGSIDWATDDHSVCVVDAAGNIRDEFVVDHTEQGLQGLCRRLISNEMSGGSQSNVPTDQSSMP